MTMPLREQHANLASTLLDGGIDASQTTVDVLSGAVFPSTGNFRVIVGSEVMLCTARSSNTLTVVRGVDGSSAASHSDAAPIAMIYTYQGITDLFQDTNWQVGYASALPVYGVFDDNGVDLLDDSDFTWVNQGSATVAVSGLGLTMVLPTDAAATNVRMLARTPGGGSWTYVAAMKGFGLHDGSATVQFGIGFRESATGKLVVIGYGAGSTNNTQRRLVVSRWTDEDTLSGTLVVDNGFMLVPEIVWFKAEYDGTDIFLSVSNDGIEWLELHTEAENNHFTTAPDQIIWYGLNGTNSISPLIAKLVHWHKE